MANEPNNVRRTTIRRLRQELVADVELANSLLHELNRYLKQLRSRASELLRVEAPPDHLLIKYDFSGLEWASFVDITNSNSLVTESLQSIADNFGVVLIGAFNSGIMNSSRLTMVKIIRHHLEEEEDRLNALPDCILIEIISRLPTTKEAIRTSTISKRWKHMWTSVSNVVFHHFKELGLTSFYTSVCETLAKCSRSNLDKFELIITKADHRIHRLVNDWIRHAIRRNVKKLELTLVSGGYATVDQSFFNVSSFTDLKLDGFVYQPYGAICWTNLRTLLIRDGELDEGLIEKIMRGSPCLETFRLDGCYGFDRIDITCRNVKSFVFVGSSDRVTHDESRIIEINAPHILSLKIIGDLAMRKLLLVDVSSLVEAELDYLKFGYYNSTANEAKEQMLKDLILSLRDVKELKIGSYCFKPFFCLKAQGFDFSSNVKVVGVPLKTDYDSNSSDYDNLNDYL
ncbi:F-box/LRR-repeat protein 25-like protein [Tanacetum coccineum]